MAEIEMECTCNACPVQYEGTVNGYPFYFRSSTPHRAVSAAALEFVRAVKKEDANDG